MKKVFTPVGVTFKGSGFFKTDNRGKKSASETSSKKDGDSKSESSRPIRPTRPFEVVRFETVWGIDEEVGQHLRLEAVGPDVDPSGEVGNSDVGLMLIPLADSASNLGAEIGVFGGSGFYELLDDPVEVELSTPFGALSSTISVGMLAGRRIAFLARHGRHHGYAAHRIPYRANVWAMALARRPFGDRSLFGGVAADADPPRRFRGRRSAHRPHERPAGHIPRRRVGGRAAGAYLPVHHQSFAEPYDAGLRRTLVDACGLCDLAVHDGGTMVVINGPLFSTRVESIWFRQMGWSVVNMTGYPESVLAAEANLPYASIALVTDDDAGVDGHVLVPRWMPCWRSFARTW